MTPQSANATDFSAFDQTKNQIKSTLGFQYDSAGNLTADPTSATMGYDAENHQTAYTKSGTTNYAYDGGGHRVTKSAGGTTTVFVYNIAGQLIAEYGGPATNGGISYLTTDHLGSTRAVTNGSKGVIARHDYFPFGEEIPAGLGSSRTAALGYVTTDDTTQRFTSKERDNESGLDHFGARYFSSAQGRFTSVDPSLAHPSGPQSWNRYTYTLNNPLRLVDPNGAEPVPPQTIYPPPNAREALFYARHPSIGSQVGTYERGSTNITTNTIRFSTRIGLQENSTREGTEVNAYRHVLWQAAITTKFGAGIATQVGNAHEDQPHVDLSVRVFRGKDALAQADQTIDLLNNEIGRAIGAANPDASMKQLALLTLDAFHTTGFYEAITNDKRRDIHRAAHD